MEYIENLTFDEISVGDKAELSRELNTRDIELFAVISGDENPAHSMWGGALISSVLGTQLPGPGTVYLTQSLNFFLPVELGDEVLVRVTVREKIASKNQLVFDCECFNQDGELVIKGEAKVIAPTVKIRRPRAAIPEVHLHEHAAHYQQLIEKTKNIDPIRVAVVHPCDEVSLLGAIEAKDKGIIEPILIGPKAKIIATAEKASCNLDGIKIINVPHSHAAAAAAVEEVRANHVDAIMKGKLHTDELMSPIVDAKNGLRTERRMSHIFALDVPTYHKALFITDAAINIAPDLTTKRDIVQNAIELLHTLGNSSPKVAILSAVETINAKMLSTIDAAALCKMAERMQITGGILDGPLAFDNAISKASAASKELVSEVAGDADILLAPDLEAANMLAKQLIYLAGAESAGIVLGATVPIILTSRSDGILSRLASCVLAQLYVHHRSIEKHAIQLPIDKYGGNEPPTYTKQILL
ncbi:bifunctional enoyl-CoA hydratase/phosphate acetyltransferase [Brumicola nitratireducens]|uniref:Bifunctional enoyl-CoA hydratase/phosphate acetyltransferase n=1 Tax=Glaciecola nitratireducens (strain JCM 12485 / KCTC 12276 / FR1064) TaxID=1085623 RepID=G4QN87_GLANF|nr:bifunctional enoyl-CoA hydratase/phosphate acetyltransferase [Glaciecola nitratireducens]AEP31506.1 bifunctional enoyl-CoA hydratase/phosphate acetyltransferase [Glaciecola nitratireducens FR1064]